MSNGPVRMARALVRSAPPMGSLHRNAGTLCFHMLAEVLNSWNCVRISSSGACSYILTMYSQGTRRQPWYLQRSTWGHQTILELGMFQCCVPARTGPSFGTSLQHALCTIGVFGRFDLAAFCRCHTFNVSYVMLLCYVHCQWHQ